MRACVRVRVRACVRVRVRVRVCTRHKYTRAAYNRHGRINYRLLPSPGTRVPTTRVMLRVSTVIIRDRICVPLKSLNYEIFMSHKIDNIIYSLNVLLKYTFNITKKKKISLNLLFIDSVLN